jgi:hypothetical protein
MDNSNGIGCHPIGSVIFHDCTDYLLVPAGYYVYLFS